MIRAEQLTRRFGDTLALDSTDVHIREHATTVIMGGSGSGKTTLLRLLAALDTPTSGAIWFDGDDLAHVSRKRLYELRARMGMVFQYSALLNSLNVYDNVAFPLHEHTELDESVIRTIVSMKLEQVGLRGFEQMMPSELSGGMAKRVAFARALAMDPGIVFFDEPTSGLDPISAGVVTTLIHDLTQKTKMTSVVVTHDVHAGLSIADHVVLLWQGRIIMEGTPDEIRQSTDERVSQFIEGRPDGPIPFSSSKTPYIDDLLGGAGGQSDQVIVAPNGFERLLGRLGRKALGAVAWLGDMASVTGSSLALIFAPPWQGKHFILQLYALGVGSFVIIAITGAFTGMVLSLQGYYTLAKFGSESLLGSAVALSIIRELGPVLGALMLVGRAGSSITAEIGIMRVTEQLDALQMMAVNPQARIILPRIVATTISLPLLVTMFDIVGLAAGYVVGVELLGVNAGAFTGEMIAKVLPEDLYAGWTKALAFGLLVGSVCTYIGYRAVPTTEGVAKATTQAVVVGSVGILMLDYILTSFFL